MIEQPGDHQGGEEGLEQNGQHAEALVRRQSLANGAYGSAQESLHTAQAMDGFRCPGGRLDQLVEQEQQAVSDINQLQRVAGDELPGKKHELYRGIDLVIGNQTVEQPGRNKEKQRCEKVFQPLVLRAGDFHICCFHSVNINDPLPVEYAVSAGLQKKNPGGGAGVPCSAICLYSVSGLQLYPGASPEEQAAQQSRAEKRQQAGLGDFLRWATGRAAGGAAGGAGTDFPVIK